MSTQSSLLNILITTRVRTAIRAAVAAGVGSAVAYFATKWGQFHTGYFAVAAPVLTAAYYTGISWAETKFPALGWLLGLLPQKKTPVAPQPKPAPVNPTPAPVVPVTPAASKAAKSTAPKKTASKGSKAVK